MALRTVLFDEISDIISMMDCTVVHHDHGAWFKKRAHEGELKMNTSVLGRPDLSNYSGSHQGKLQELRKAIRFNEPSTISNVM